MFQAQTLQKSDNAFSEHFVSIIMMEHSKTELKAGKAPFSFLFDGGEITFLSLNSFCC